MREAETATAEPYHNSINWTTGWSHWPFSHTILPFVMALLFSGSLHPVVRVSIVAMLSLVWEVYELLTNCAEHKWDATLDNALAVIGATAAVSMTYATGLEPLDIVPSGGEQRLAKGIALCVAAGLLASTFFVNEQGGSSVHARKEEKEGAWVFPWYMLLSQALVVAATAALCAVTGRWHWVWIVALLSFAQAAPIWTQTDERGILWATVSMSGLAVLATGVAIGRHPRAVLSALRSF